MLKPLLSLFLPILFLAAVNAAADINNSPKPDDIALQLQRVADWQIKHFRGTYSGRKKPHHIRDWTNGALYVGMLKWASISGDPRYLQWLKDLADKGHWELHHRIYMADDHVVGQLYLDLYRRYNDSEMIRKTKDRLDYIMANPSQEPIELGAYDHLQRWTWCDALFMGPPVWAKMSSITGDRKYRDWMLEEFKATTDHLFDPKEGLYYRDNNFIGKRVHGKKVFWSRGNGWVFAGLTLVMDELDPESRQYAYYKKIYLKMARTLRKIQTAQGHWAMSLANAENFPTPETSGTSFFTYGLSWGINNGLLKKKKYLPTILKAWSALVSHITPEGMLGYVQPIGAAPGDAWPDKSEVYGSGAFLAAGSQLYILLGGERPVQIPRSQKLDGAIDHSNALLIKELTNLPRSKLPSKLPNKGHAAKPKVSKSPLFARFVPERDDDFAWENDMVAFRAYGPKLRKGKENSGTDCWMKRVSYPVINKWYRQHLEHGKSYHEDRGEGYDGYHVGASAGCGSSALWLDGKRVGMETFTEWKSLDITKTSLSFDLVYELDANGDRYKEVRHITLIPGVRLFRVDTRFWKNGAVASNLPVAVGVTTHNGRAETTFNTEKKWLSAYEKLDGFNLGTGIYVQSDTPVNAIEVKPDNDDDTAHALFIAHTNNQGALTYFAGYAWEKAKAIQDKAQWHGYLDNFSDAPPY